MKTKTESKSKLKLKQNWIWLSACVLLSLCGCEDDQDEVSPITQDTTYTGMTGTTADCEFDVVSFSISGGDPIEVSINGLPVQVMDGAEKVADTTWEVVTRRGVSFDDILTKAGIPASSAAPVNCIARDNFDPLRTKLQGDKSMLPTMEFFRNYGYVYIGNPGDKDPLYPEMEGRSLIVDYDVSTDAEVPEYMGGAISAIGMFRWKMVEKIDDTTFGVFEIGPVVK